MSAVPHRNQTAATGDSADNCNLQYEGHGTVDTTREYDREYTDPPVDVQVIQPINSTADGDENE